MTTTRTGHLDEDDFARGLLELRNTPRAEGRSPAQVLFGHPMRSAVPAHHRSFALEWQLAAGRKHVTIPRFDSFQACISVRTLTCSTIDGIVLVSSLASDLVETISL